MLTREKLISQYGEENVRFAGNFSEHSKNLPPTGFMVKVARRSVIKNPPPFNPEELFFGTGLFEVPATWKPKPREQWTVQASKLLGGLDGSSVHVVTNQLPDRTGHQLVKRKFVVVRAGVAEQATKACHDLEVGLLADPPQQYTWEQFYDKAKLLQLRTTARQQRMQIARDFMVGTGMCSVEDASVIEATDDMVTNDIALRQDDKEHFYVCSGVVMPFSVSRSVLFYEGPAMGFRLFTGRPDATGKSMLGKGLPFATTTGAALTPIPCSFGLQRTDRFGDRRTPFTSPLGDGSSVFHYMDAYRPYNADVLQEARLAGGHRDASWTELVLRQSVGLIA